MGVRVAFIGCGGIARNHMRQLSAIDGAELVAFCDAVEGKAEEVAAQYGGRAYTDHRKMLDGEKIDALYVCLPPYAHADQEILAAERGIALFVEKPVARTAEKADEISEAISRGGVISSVGYQWRYTEASEMMKAVLGGRKVAFVEGAWIGGMPGVSWWRVMAESGGQAVEQTTHIFDLARYVVGEVTEVQAFERTGLMTDVEGYDVHDATVANLRFKNGAIGTIISSCVVSRGGRVGLAVFCRGLTAENFGGKLTVHTDEKTEIFYNRRDPYMEEDRIFIEAVETRDGSRILSSYADAVKTLKVTLAVNESIAKGGMPIKL